MRSEIKELFIEERYTEALSLCKQLLQEDPQDHDLWYSLFLAENDNYININFESLNNEMAFNKACDLADENQRIEYISEYNFYKNISSIPYMRQLYRYAQLEMGESAIAVIEKLDKEKHTLDIEDKDGFYEYLYQAVSTTTNPDLLNINAMITKLLYFITDDEQCMYYAKKLYKLAADSGNLNAAVELAKIYDSEGNTKLSQKYKNVAQGVATDNEDNDVLLKLAADLKFSSNKEEQEKAFDMYNDLLDYKEFQCRAGLAYCYFFGVGTIANQEKGYKNASIVIQEYEEDPNIDVDSDDIDMVYRIAGLYYRGDYNRSKDINKAIRYFKVSADNNWLSTLYLAECYLEAAKYTNAKELINDMIANERVEGYYLEAYCYLLGLGVPKDIYAAVEFANKALDIKEYADAYAILYIACTLDSSLDPNNNRQKFMDRANDLGSSLMFRWGSAQVIAANNQNDLNIFLNYLTQNYRYCEPDTITALSDYYYNIKNYKLAYRYFEVLLNTPKRDYGLYSIGYMYENGLYVEKNITEAKDYYSKSNNKDALEALRRLNQSSQQQNTFNSTNTTSYTSTPKKPSVWWTISSAIFPGIMFFVWLYQLKNNKAIAKRIGTGLIIYIVVYVLAILANM